MDKSSQELIRKLVETNLTVNFSQSLLYIVIISSLRLTDNFIDDFMKKWRETIFDSHINNLCNLDVPEDYSDIIIEEINKADKQFRKNLMTLKEEQGNLGL